MADLQQLRFEHTQTARACPAHLNGTNKHAATKLTFFRRLKELKIFILKLTLLYEMYTMVPLFPINWWVCGLLILIIVFQIIDKIRPPLKNPPSGQRPNNWPKPDRQYSYASQKKPDSFVQFTSLRTNLVQIDQKLLLLPQNNNFISYYVVF